MSVYQQLNRRAEVLDRWASIYGGGSVMADWARLAAAQRRFAAEVVKAAHLEEMSDWTARQLAKSPRIYSWLGGRP